MTGRSVLHVGYHKTATTWFQKEFYPAVTNARYVPRSVVHRALIEPRPLDFDSERAREVLGRGRGERLLLCDEELSGNIHVGGLHGCATVEFARRLHATLPDADVVIFHRDLVDHVASAYHQYVKEGGTRSPRDYIFGDPRQHRRPTFSPDHFELEPLTRHYSSLFGPERVHVFRFEDFAADASGFVSTYADRLDLTYREDAIDWDRRPNPSFGTRTIALARLTNVLTRRDVADKYYLMHIPLFYKASRLLLRWLNGIRLIRGTTSSDAILGDRVVGWLRDGATPGR